MRANVLKDPALVKQAGQFAWLSIDSDKPSNQAFNEKFANGGVPLFVVIDPATEKAALAWYGTATEPQLSALLADGARAIAGKVTGADALLARADALNGEKKPAEAAALYDQALQNAGPDWPHRTRAVESLVMAYDFARNQDACVQTAVREAPAMRRDRSFVNTVYFGLGCAKPGSPELKKMEELAEEGVKIPGVLGDDTSSLYQSLAAIYRRDDDTAAATRTASAWLAYLQKQIAKAPNAEARLGYDLHLVQAAGMLQKPELALAEVERAERDLPDDYNPPRLAGQIYEDMGRLDDALAACGRALEKAYGPRKVSLYLTRGRLLEKKGDDAAAKRAYMDGLAYAKTLPEAVAKPLLPRLEQLAGKK
jgi:tetratricopeptide (TPR) repeat protein